MSVESVAAFVELLRESKLLDAAQLDELGHGGFDQFSHPRALADDLLQRGWITPFQADQLLEGQGKDLILGAYRVLERLGQGSTGHVFKARHQRMNRIVALKLIRSERLAEPDAVQRFHREVQAAAQLNHPNIVVAYDADQVGNTQFFAMEYVDGIDLAKVVKNYGPPSVPQACDYIRQVARGLQHAHDRGMVHRDIKPYNLLVTRTSNKKFPFAGGTVKILDMGLARLQQSQPSLSRPEFSVDAPAADNLQPPTPTPGTAEGGDTALTFEGALMGTPDYIAPEQALNSQLADIRADLYSLGCTFYFLLAGRPPFPGGSVMKKLLSHQQIEPTPIEELRPEVPKGVAAIVRKLMAKSPEDRFQTPAEVAGALEPFCRAEVDEQVILRGHSSWARSVAFSPDGRVLASGGGEGAVRLWQLSSSKAKSLGVLKGHTGHVYAVAFAPDGRTVASGSWDRTVRLWDLGDPGSSEPHEKAVLQGHANWVRAVAFAANGKLLASGGAEGVVRLWDVSGPKPREGVVLRGHVREVRSVAFSPDSLVLASGSWDKTLRIWYLAGEQPKEGEILKGHRDGVMSVAFSPNGKALVSGGHDKTVRVWRHEEGGWRERLTLKGHFAPVYSVAFAPDGKTLVSAGYDGQVILWSASSGRRLCKWSLPGPVYSAAYHPEARYLACGNDNGTVCILRMPILVSRNEK